MDAYPAEPHLPEPPQECPYGPLIKALLSYRQADEDGVMCIVSRQAVHEAADALAAKDAEIERLRARIAEKDEVLRTIQTAAEFHAQDGVADHVMRYAHESTARLARKALEG